MTTGSIRAAVVEQADLLTAALLSLAAVGVALLAPGLGAARVALAVPFVLFLPGYALSAALFPEAARVRASGDAAADVPNVGSLQNRLLDRSGLTTVERVAFSVAASAALVPAVALVASFTVGVTLRPWALGVAGLTVALAALGVARRRALPETRRSGVRPTARLRRFARRYFSADGPLHRDGRPFEATGRRDVLVNAAVAASVLVFLVGAGAAAAVGAPDQPYTEFYVTGDHGNASGSVVASAAAGATNRTLVVTNREGHPVTYTVVTDRQRVRGGNVTDEQAVATRSRTLAPGATWRRPIDLSGVSPGPNVRLRFGLYEGDVGGSPDLSLTLWYRDAGTGGRFGDLAAPSSAAAHTGSAVRPAGKSGSAATAPAGTRVSA